MDQMTAVFINTGDLQAASQMAGRTLALSTVIQGLDCHETIQHHIQYALLEAEQSNLTTAWPHLISAKYLIQLVGGERHPELCNIFYRLSSIYERAEDYQSAWLAILRARLYTNDLPRSCSLTMAAASLCFRMQRFSESVTYQKQAYKLFRELYGVDDERVQSAKKALETYIRSCSGDNRASSPSTLLAGSDIDYRRVESTVENDGIDIQALKKKKKKYKGKK
jgi:hypothetical protein